MKAILSIGTQGTWCVDITADTPSEKAILDAVAKGYGVKCECSGTPETLKITGYSSDTVVTR